MGGVASSRGRYREYFQQHAPSRLRDREYHNGGHGPREVSLLLLELSRVPSEPVGGSSCGTYPATGTVLMFVGFPGVPRPRSRSSVRSMVVDGMGSWRPCSLMIWFTS